MNVGKLYAICSLLCALSISSIPGYCSAAYHCLDLLSESMVQQSIHKRVDSRIKQNHCLSNGYYNRTNVIG